MKEAIKYRNKYVGVVDKEMTKATILLTSKKWQEALNLLHTKNDSDEANLFAAFSIFYCAAHLELDNATKKAKKVLDHTNFTFWPYLEEHNFPRYARRFALRFLSYMAYEKGKYKKALKYINEALDIDSPIDDLDNTEFLEMKIRILLKIDKEDAYFTIKKLLKLDSKNDSFKEIITSKEYINYHNVQIEHRVTPNETLAYIEEIQTIINNKKKEASTDFKYEIISFDDASKKFTLPDPICDINDVSVVIVITGTALIKEDLDDWYNSILEGNNDFDGTLTVVVDGDIIVEGVFPGKDDFNAHIYVTGNVYCDVLRSCDEAIQIDGDAYVAYVYDGNYNDGQIYMSGKMEVPFLLNSDHCSEITPSEKTIKICYYGDDGNFDYDIVQDDFEESLIEEVTINDDDEIELDRDAFIEIVKSKRSPLK